MERPFHAYRGEEPFVFVSYAHGDMDVVYPEIARLDEAGFQIWYDEGISPGSTWRDELAHRIQACSAFLFFVSDAAVGSMHCLKEVNYALDNGKPVFAVHLRETRLPPGLSLSLSDVQAILRYEVPEADYRELIDTALAKATGTRPTPESPAAARDAADTTSIAVLPFTNLSSDPENEYLSDGITEELINGFSGLDGLKVAPRLAAFAYKGQNVDEKTAAAKLGVANVLSGSVQKSGNRVRIRVQLTRASDGDVLWSERYDDTLDDIFDLQDDLARKVVAALKVQLDPGRTDPFVTVGTRSPQAYEAYLAGHYEIEKFTRDGARRAIEHYRHAVQYDPDFAEAHACLAYAYAMLAGPFGARDEAVTDALKAAYRRAVLLGFATGRGLTHTQWRITRDAADGSRAGSRPVSELLDSAIERIRFPHHPDNAGNPKAGFFELMNVLNAAVLLRAELAVIDHLDPTRKELPYPRGIAISKLGDRAGAIDLYTRVLERDHNNHFARHFRGLDCLRVGRRAEADADLEFLDSVWGPRNFHRLCHLLLIDDPSAPDYFEDLVSRRNFEPRLKCVSAALTGDVDRALDYLEAGTAAGNPAMTACWQNLYLYDAPCLEAIESNPRFTRWRETRGLTDAFRRQIVEQVNALTPMTGLEIG